MFGIESDAELVTSSVSAATAEVRLSWKTFFSCRRIGFRRAVFALILVVVLRSVHDNCFFGFLRIAQIWQRRTLLWLRLLRTELLLDGIGRRRRRSRFENLVQHLLRQQGRHSTAGHFGEQLFQLRRRCRRVNLNGGLLLFARRLGGRQLLRLRLLN